MDITNSSKVIEHQADANLAQANPIQDQWYTVIDTSDPGIFYSCGVRIDTTGEDLELEWTIDGTTYTSVGTACVAGSNYHAYLTGNTVTNVPYIQTNAALTALYSGIFFKELRVRIRKTSNAGAGTLRCRVQHGEWKQ